MRIKEIAQLAGVSNATISKIINGKDQNISEGTRKRVLAIIEREGYIPNGVAKSLRMSNTKTIGLIMPDVMNLFFSELVRGAEDFAEQKGYSVILCNSDNKEFKEEKYLKILQEKKVDGIILTASEKSVKKSLVGKRIPLVILDRDISINQDVGKILLDNEEGISKGVKYLASRGCKDIGFISSENISISAVDRFKGYKKGLKESGLEFMIEKVFLKNFTIDSGYDGVMGLLNRTKLDGIVCGNDLIAIGAIKALQDGGLKVPDDVKIIGFDDISISKYIFPPLTTIRQPIYEMGKESVSLLIDIIEKKDTNLTKIFDSELIIRGSA